MAMKEKLEQVKGLIEELLSEADQPVEQPPVVQNPDGSVDNTPYDQAYVDEQVAKAVAAAKEQAVKDVEAAGKAKDLKEEAIGKALEDLAAQVRALTLTQEPAKEDGAAPAEESVPTPEAPASEEAPKSDEQA